MDFVLGCNYWASNAGADMWRDFDADCVKNDIRILAEYGIKHIRVFPNWRDFQPIMPLFNAKGGITGYCLENERECENPYYLDEVMMERFSLLLAACAQYGIKVIVGLITGWMSGRLYIPTAVYRLNTITDPLAQYFEQLFIKGFVSRFKDNKSIIAWDLGNECNCMGSADRVSGVNWTAMISNAIRAEDPTRPIVSGMHSLEVEHNKAWSINDQAMFTDILTTHPYPYWCDYTRIDEVLSLRTTMHATAQTKFYAEIGEKPCMAEELGTMGPMLCSDENAAKFLRLNMFSLWANGANGVMWWCANEQSKLIKFPYTENMCEVELGMLDKDLKAKPVLNEMKKFSSFAESLDFTLPNAETDAVCLLTKNQRQWGIGYMTHILLRKAGLNCRFAYAENGLPESKLYIMPSINGITVMNKKYYEELKQKVYRGATLYISVDNAILSDFETLMGLRVVDSYENTETSEVTVDGENIPFNRNRKFVLEEKGATVLAYDSEKNPTIAVNQYGEGRVYFVNFPLENNLVDRHNAFSGGEERIYRKVFADYIDRFTIRVKGENVFSTYHCKDESVFVVAVNHSDGEQRLDVKYNGYILEKIYYGDIEKIAAFDACVFKFKKEK